MLRWFLCTVMVLVPSVTWAQTPEPIQSYTLEVFASGVSPTTGTSMMTPVIVPVSGAVCNLAPVAVPALVTNPMKMRIVDPSTDGRECEFSGPSVAAALTNLPIGTGYVATVKANGATLSSARSAASNPFSKAVGVGPPAPPSGVKVLP